MAQFWSTLGDESHVRIDVEFHGIVPSSETLSFSTAAGFARVNVRVRTTEMTIGPIDQPPNRSNHVLSAYFLLLLGNGDIGGVSMLGVQQP